MVIQNTPNACSFFSDGDNSGDIHHSLPSGTDLSSLPGSVPRSQPSSRSESPAPSGMVSSASIAGSSSRGSTPVRASHDAATKSAIMEKLQRSVFLVLFILIVKATC